MSSNMTFAGGRWTTKEAAVANLQKMLGLDKGHFSNKIQ
jgi:hypothetical protein